MTMIRPLSGLAAMVLLAAWAVPSSGQPPAKKDATKDTTKSTGPAPRVQVRMDQLPCLKTPDRGDKTDEVFLVVAGKAPAGRFKKQLPGDKDIYVFKAGQKAGSTGWKTKDGKEKGRPVLY